MIDWLFITGTRAEFAKTTPLIEGVVEANKTYRIICCGMHLLEEYGFTATEVMQQHSKNIVVASNVFYGTPMEFAFANMARSVGDFLRSHPVENLVVHGDRVEALAAGIAGALAGCRVVHVEGGEVSGTIDESIRHALTKVAHAHLVSNEEAARRVVALGEAPERVFVIGSPEMDAILRMDTSDMASVRARYDIAFDDYYVCIFHPVVTQPDFYATVKEVFRALRDSGKKFVCLRPNNDKNAAAIHAELDALADSADFRVLPSLRFEAFITLVANSRALVGNSSSGVREAPALGVWSIDIGDRQHNRSPARSVIRCAAEYREILSCLDRCESLARPPVEMIFGDGKAKSRFMKLLENGAFADLPMQKTFYETGDSGNPGQG